MFQTFSGTSRRPRNVNLSGQNHNPFASRPTGLGGTSAVALAQQERKARQVERQKLQAAKDIQRHWRGHATRHKTRLQCRELWDQGRPDLEKATVEGSQRREPQEKTELDRARFLGWFASKGDEGDVERVCLFTNWLDGFLSHEDSPHLAHEWSIPLVKLSKFGLLTLGARAAHQKFLPSEASDAILLRLVAHTASQFPDALAGLGQSLYDPLGKIAAKVRGKESAFAAVLLGIIGTTLTRSESSKDAAYEGFVQGFMTKPDLPDHLDLAKLASISHDYHLAKSMRKLLSSTSRSSILASMPLSNLLWTLAYFIHFQRLSASSSQRKSPNIDYIASLTVFLSNLNEVIGRSQNIHDTTNAKRIPQFVEDEIASLVNQESIMGLIAHSELTGFSGKASSAQSEDAAVLASYALVLLQTFKRRADDIRGWLYMSSTPSATNRSEEPAIKYFWRAVEKSGVYRKIFECSDNATNLLKQDRTRMTTTTSQADLDQEWRVIFLFLELYTFVLKIMDDDEFMTGNRQDAPHSWTRQSALQLSQVRDFTTFLKNLAFAMYWNPSEIMSSQKVTEPHHLASYFGNSSLNPQLQKDLEQHNPPVISSFGGVEGMTLSYMKGMVTGLLRMLYERDSRRHFCKPGHWLKDGFEMKGFIDAVVVEQTFRNNQDEEQNEDGDEEHDAMDLDVESDDEALVGTARTQQIRRLEKLRLQQRKTARQKQLFSLTPRLEILQNMPFFIPFPTRVEIFRHFVMADQIHRRNGFLDPDQWRLSMAGSMFAGGSNPLLSRHAAKVRREHVFEDAFEQFYQLGEGFKEPIQITFVDQFDSPEAGIDGGGVTKEFLTSVTNEAFSVENGGKLFVENDQHLLYPNPSVIDEQKELLREFQVREGSPEWNTNIRELLQQYEFLGRVVGKCLYEGILEDIHFAPFFLVKWALTGGSSAASNESGYRANINDLRDLDEELYQNLLKLKNYPGNVEDFGLDFTITDVIQRNSDGTAKKSITRELRRGGAQIPVTNTNRLIYITAVARHRLQTQPVAQTNAFLQGLSSMIQPAWLSMFNQSELQTLLGGDSSEIDVADLRANTLYGGVYTIGDDGQEHPTVQKFWNVLKAMGDEDRRKVLKYVTSTPRGPLLGFAQLNPRFSIRDSGSDQTRLPSTSTCVNLLKLPIYQSEEALREKLLYAVHAGAGFHLS